MKKFIFRLEILLKLRKANEGTLKRELEHTLQKLNQAKGREKTLQSQIDALVEEIAKKRREGKLDLQETYSQILDHLNQTFRQENQNIAAIEKQIDQQRGVLSQAVLQRKVIEKIKEKHYTGWRNKQSQTEETLLDEISFHGKTDSN
jgi:flagellar protein FliJ